MKLLLEDEETRRLGFRKLIPSDFRVWLPFHQDPRSSKYWKGLPANPEIACREQFDRIFERYEKNLGGMNALISKSSGHLIGLCGLMVQTVDGIQELEIGYSILPNYWQKGFATEAAEKCKTHAFENASAKSLISIVQVNNVPSQKVALNLGMVVESTTLYRENEVHIFRVRP